MIKVSSKSETKQTKKKDSLEGFADLSVIPPHLNKPTKTQTKTHIQI